MKVWRNILLYDLLTYGGEEYTTLMMSMLSDDFYILQDRVYDFVYEIKDNSKLIGFASGTCLGGGVCLELFYLLPSFRGKGFFKDFLNYCTGQYRCVVLDRPNHFSMCSLIKNGFAENVGEGLWYSFFPLSFEDYDTDERLYSHLYDTRLSAIVYLPTKKISPLQEVDIICFNAQNGREKYFTDNYFNDLDFGKIDV